MQIKSWRATSICTKTDKDKSKRDFTPIYPGERGYNFDLKDQNVVNQLRALRDAEIISIDIPLPGDKDNDVRESTKKVKRTRRHDNRDKGGRGVSDKITDESPTRS